MYQKNKGADQLHIYSATALLICPYVSHMKKAGFLMTWLIYSRNRCHSHWFFGFTLYLGLLLYGDVLVMKFSIHYENMPMQYTAILHW